MKAGANNRVLFFSGAEANPGSSWNKFALDELTKKLGEVSKKGDVLIFDENTSRNLIGKLADFGFKPKLEGNYTQIVNFSVWEKTE